MPNVAVTAKAMKGDREKSLMEGASDYICKRVDFFFSSRRRHTWCSRDWSSDVCSSDLSHHDVRPAPRRSGGGECRARRAAPWCERSEERRVGKECRSRWSPNHEKQK